MIVRVCMRVCVDSGADAHDWYVFWEGDMGGSDVMCAVKASVLISQSSRICILITT